jgi:hypothetical protein
MTKTVNLGDTEKLYNESTLNDAGWNFVLIHRSTDPLDRWWGNFCSHIVSKIALHYENKENIPWIAGKIFKFCYKQYDTYGDYYRLLDNSFGEADKDTIYEVY